jgi:hypothetical protein
MWRVRDIDAWLIKRQVARTKPAPYAGIVKRQMEQHDAR